MDPALERVPEKWTTTWDTGMNPRTLQRLLGLGLIERQKVGGKRYWRRKREKNPERSEEGIRRRTGDQQRVAKPWWHRTQDNELQP